MPALAIGTNGAPLVAVAERPRRVVTGLLAIASGLLLGASFPGPDLEPLAWVGFVPLLFAIRRRRPRSAFVAGWLTGTVFYLVTVHWVAYTITRYTAVPMAAAAGILVLMCAILALYHGVFAGLLRWFEDRGLPALWLAAPLWVTLEWMRSWLFVGFPWASLGYSQYHHHDLVQMVEVTGVYGISAVLVLFNVVAAAVLDRRTRPLRELVPALVVLTVLVVGVPLAGRWRVAEVASRAPAGTLRVALVQGNVEQDHKWDPAYQADTIQRYRELTIAAAGAGAELVVWPETATPFFFQEPGPHRRQLLDLAEQLHVFLLFGSPAARRGSDGTVEEMNRAYLVSPEGREIALYDKMTLVPFGEYVPYREVLFFVDRIVEAVGNIVPGTTASVFRLPSATFGVPICYEDVFPSLTREFIAGGGNFLVNITNDAWYGRTAAPQQHLAQATFRAVENRVPLVRAANTGISAIVDPDGRVRWQSRLFEPTWHAEEIAWHDVRTFYTRYGDVFAWACALASLGAIGYGALRSWRRG